MFRGSGDPPGAWHSAAGPDRVAASPQRARGPLRRSPWRRAAGAGSFEPALLGPLDPALGGAQAVRRAFLSRRGPERYGALDRREGDGGGALAQPGGGPGATPP